ncbi:hypothetical protein BWI06_RS21915 [Vibrio parahaemolyticus]|uniref:DUF3693 domain-containing protein n=1 Tax=Vibrio parahaemolyticus TaxID=670 RepID=UPI0009AFE535|nr:DUF3693 domain-containing protein [Vibrio parahaemolyticus]EHH2510944.1 hypothetical protein [Vibrio parahaemolyticus]EJE4561336.1 hypothetical protein [Vibrio parahaemolyticus]EJG1767945.1 hypothetical protein [Vibrio parahaemolyticus]ELA7366188.1 hypothetical protein [Vibrio parahaemolyticus]HCE5172950.1 hypothetical protein [Vibrio parahaemolyticus]
MKAVWKGISKKFDWFGISRFSMVCAGLALVIASPQEPLLQYALWALMLNTIAYAYPIKCLSFEGQFNEVSRND